MHPDPSLTMYVQAPAPLLTPTPSLLPLVTIQCDDPTRKALEHLLRRLPCHAAYNTTAPQAMQLICAALQPYDLEQIMHVRDVPTAAGVVVFRNGPRTAPADLPATPTAGPALTQITVVQTHFLLGMALLLGRPYGYPAEQDGALVHQIRPVRGQEMARSNAGSAVDHRLHTEIAGLTCRPHFLALVCLRADPHGEARTTVADARTLCQHLDEESLATLRRPEFRLRIPHSFDAGSGGTPWTAPLPVLTGPAELPELRLNLNGIQAVTPQATAALTALTRVLDIPGVVEEIALAPGDLLLLCNRRTVHGRTPFRSRYDGQDRWYQRIYIRRDFWAERAHFDAEQQLVRW